MRVSLLILICVLSAARPASAQSGLWQGPHDPGHSPMGMVRIPGGSPDGLKALESAALAGDRRASALLAVLLQDMPAVEGGLVKSALHFQVAIAAGCADLDALSARAVARLSPAQSRAYQQALPRWVPAGGSVVPAALRGRCLSW